MKNQIDRRFAEDRMASLRIDRIREQVVTEGRGDQRECLVIATSNLGDRLSLQEQVDN